MSKNINGKEQISHPREKYVTSCRLSGAVNKEFQDMDLGDRTVNRKLKRVDLSGGGVDHGFKDVDLGDGLTLGDNYSMKSEEFIGKTKGSNCKDTGSDMKNEAPKTETVSLKRHFTVKHLVAILVSGIGTSAIFLTPGPILVYSGSPGLCLILWFAGGLFNLAVALCFTEVATIFPDAGGPYAYVVQTFGSLPGFLTVWGYTCLLLCPVWAITAYISALYLVKPFYPSCDPPFFGVRLLAGVVLIACVALNCVSVKCVSKVQMFLTSTKLIALLIIITSGIYSMATGNLENFEQPFEGTTAEPGQVSLAIFAAHYSYGGWQSITNLVEESKRPEKDLPKAVFISFIITVLAFCLTITAYFAVLGQNEILNSEAVAVLYIQRLYEPLTPLISALVVISTIGSLNSLVLGHSRWLFAAGRNGHMPCFVGMIHVKYLTPWPALMILSVVTLCLVFWGDVLVLIEYASFITIIVALEVLFVLVYFRWKKIPDRNATYKTSLPVTIVLILIHIVVLVLAVYQKPREMGIAIAAIVTGIPLYWLGVSWKTKPKAFEKFLETLTMVTQCTLNLKKTE